MAPDGLLSPLGDPLGQVLDKGLKPIGHFTGQIAKPAGQALLDVKEQGKKDLGVDDKSREKDEKPGGERIGGNQQTGQNPLGL
ncbi:hypothetical protein LTR37_005859 [Vermiconidia calcicola]|uniref:Uncharacterized protein n=1 Tax=Vermiconidia calcicola TaxID=1690605 RepID=A0ACC3NIB8_9PEZI|nr:hypothetical protein LTR37_005859 [Vermiconidia calcicola]